MNQPNSDKSNEESISSIDKKIEKLRKNFAKSRNSDCYLLIAGNSEITATLVDKVFDDLRKEKYGGEKLDVIVHSSGGSIDAAYNLARLFRRYGKERLTFVVPRWAKSAATLLVCAGDEILMTPVAELGPLDPQITQMNPLEQRLENFSPLHIESTLN